MNIAIFEFFNSAAGLNPFFDQTIIFLASYFGLGLVLFAGFFLLFHTHEEWLTEEQNQVLKRRIKEMLVIAVSVLGAWLIAYFIKNILEVPRPFLVLPDAHVLITHGAFDSFPSGHATFFSALASSLFLFHKRLGKWYFAGAVIIGLARIMAGIHFPLDILGGLVLGFLVAFVVARLTRVSAHRQNSGPSALNV